LMINEFWSQCFHHHPLPAEIEHVMTAN
jgi:hypothetical protein